MTDLAVILPDGAQVRKAPDGRASVYDLLKLAGAKSPAEVFKRLSEAYPDSVTKCDFIKFARSDGKLQAKPTPVTDAAGWRRIMTVLPGVIGKAYRAAANELVDQYLTDPEALAGRAVDRIKDADGLARIEQRARTRRSNRALNAEIQNRGGGKFTFATVANANNVAVTGKVAKELQLERQVKQTREGMTTLELSLVAAAEELETEAMRLRGVEGEGQIIETVREVTTDIAALRRKYTGTRDYPAGGLLMVQI